MAKKTPSPISPGRKQGKKRRRMESSWISFTIQILPNPILKVFNYRPRDRKKGKVWEMAGPFPFPTFFSSMRPSTVPLCLCLALLSSPFAASVRAPAIFLNHGPGGRPYNQPGNPDHAEVIQNWQEIGALLKSSPPRAIVLVNAHFEQDIVTITKYDDPPPLVRDLGRTYVPSFPNV